eukprot:ANDGO_02430.mRNA.1 Condensin complex subunit 3
MSRVDAVMGSLAEVFNRVQESSATHGKSVKDVLSVRASFKDNGQFRKVLLEFFNRILATETTGATMDRLQKFCFMLISKLDSEDYEEFLAYFIQKSGSKEKVVRFRACQMVAGVLDNLGLEVEIGEELWEKLQDMLKLRLYDKVPGVRAAAIHAAARLQNPADDGCPIMAMLIDLMQRDNAKEVRKAALYRVCISSKSLSAILERTRDKSDDVRKAVYAVVRSNIRVRQLSISQRVQVIMNGLRDLNDSVRKAATDMIHRSWICGGGGADEPSDALESIAEASAHSIFPFLGLLNVKDNEAAAEMVLHTELKTYHASHHMMTVPDPRKMSAEEAIALRCRVEFLVRTGNEEGLDALIQDVPTVLEWLNSAASTRTSFVMLQMIKILKVLDLSEASALSQVLQFCESRITDMSTDSMLIPPIMEVYHKSLHQLSSDLSDQVRRVAEHLSILSDPISTEALEEMAILKQQQDKKLDKLKQKKVLLEREQSRAVSRQDFRDAEKYKLEISSLVDEMRKLNVEGSSMLNETAIRLRCVTIACSVMENIDDTSLGSLDVLRGIVTHHVLPVIDHQDVEIRQCAVKALALFCLFDGQVMKDHLELFAQIAREEVLPIRQTAVQALFDFLLRHAFLSNDNSSVLSIIETLSRFLRFADDGVDESLFSATVVGFCKLYLYNRLNSRVILQKLLILFFHPDTQEMDTVNRCLDSFFSAYSFSHPKRQLVIAQCVQPVLKAVVDLPELDATNMINLLAALTDEAQLMNGPDATASSSPHDNLAISLLNEIVMDTDSDAPEDDPQLKRKVTLYVRMLNLLEIRKENRGSVRVIQTLSDQFEQQDGSRFIDKLQRKIWTTVASRVSRINTDNVDVDSDTFREVLDQAAHVLTHVSQTADQTLTYSAFRPKKAKSRIPAAAEEPVKKLTRATTANSKETAKPKSSAAKGAKKTASAKPPARRQNAVDEDDETEEDDEDEDGDDDRGVEGTEKDADEFKNLEAEIHEQQNKESRRVSGQKAGSRSSLPVRVRKDEDETESENDEVRSVSSVYSDEEGNRSQVYTKAINIAHVDALLESSREEDSDMDFDSDESDDVPARFAARDNAGASSVSSSKAAVPPPKKTSSASVAGNTKNAKLMEYVDNLLSDDEEEQEEEEEKPEAKVAMKSKSKAPSKVAATKPSAKPATAKQPAEASKRGQGSRSKASPPRASAAAASRARTSLAKSSSNAARNVINAIDRLLEDSDSD